MVLPYSEHLDTQTFGTLFDNKSESYKLFWFNAIFNRAKIGNDIFSFDELINDMIVDAWYMVSEFHLNLGPRDTLEQTIVYIQSITNFKPTISKKDLLDYLSSTKDKTIIDNKNILSLNVPYRLQSPFLNLRSEDWNKSGKSMVELINDRSGLIYTFGQFDRLNTKIVLNKAWVEYFNKNQEIIDCWIKFNMITYLQRRNPSVPGISDKLSPQKERNLNKVIKFWKVLSELEPIRDIYSNEVVTSKDISIDHFVPWSYVAHDELWNLSPTTRRINSKKSNGLPEWDEYFLKLANLEYQSYQMINKYEIAKKEFNSCKKDHINSDETFHNLYRDNLNKTEFFNQLEKTIRPSYEAARNCGFKLWKYIEG